MKALATAIFAKLSGSALDTAIGGRLFMRLAPDGTDYPYAVYLVVSAVPDDTFAKNGEEVLVQFSVFSVASSPGEIQDIVTNLRALYDDCILTITGNVLVWMKWEQTTSAIEEYATPDGTTTVWAYHVDYRVLTQAS